LYDPTLIEYHDIVKCTRDKFRKPEETAAKTRCGKRIGMFYFPITDICG